MKMKNVAIVLGLLMSTGAFATPTVSIIPKHSECICEKKCELFVRYSVNIPNDTDANQNIEVHYIIRAVSESRVKEYKRIVRKFKVPAHTTLNESFFNNLDVIFDDSHRVRHFTYGGIDIKTNGNITFQDNKEENIYLHGFINSK